MSSSRWVKALAVFACYAPLGFAVTLPVHSFGNPTPELLEALADKMIRDIETIRYAAENDPSPEIRAEAQRYLDNLPNLLDGK